jgi:hypothetical protein
MLSLFFDGICVVDIRVLSNRVMASVQLLDVYLLSRSGVVKL